MLTQSVAKINLGLNIIEKRSDNYHSIESVLYPIPLCDLIELVSSDGEFEFTQSGIQIDCPIEQNLCYKAFKLMQERFHISNVKIHLFKKIPFGAGLGGGSSNAASVIVLIDKVFKLGLLENEMQKLSAEIGSDCPFFIRSQAQLAKGRGEILSPIKIDLRAYYLILIKPDIKISTSQAYAKVKPSMAANLLKEIVEAEVSDWKKYLKNDFEDTVFETYPRIREIKESLYKNGAIYASMSGSGSSVFGIFKTKLDLEEKYKGCSYHGIWL